MFFKVWKSFKIYLRKRYSTLESISDKKSIKRTFFTKKYFFFKKVLKTFQNLPGISVSISEPISYTINIF
jgi:hypothetical protein